MAKVCDIIFCLRATNTDEQGACANTVLTALSPEYVPGLFTFSVIITLLDIEPGKEHSITIEFISPENENVVHIESQVPQIEDSSNLPQEHKGLNLAMDWNNINFKTSGLYKIQVKLDDTLLAEKSIYVKGKNQ